MAKPLAKLVSILTPKRRWAQFSLATMLVVVALLCVGLSLVVLPAKRQRQAVVALIDRGGNNLPWVGIWYDDEALPELASKSPYVRDWWCDAFHRVTVVSLFQTRQTDELLDYVGQLKGLRDLSLCDTDLTDDGLKLLANLTELRHLDIRGTDVSDDAIANIRALHRLESIILIDAGLSEATIDQLRSAMPGCHIQTEISSNNPIMRHENE